MPGDAASVSEPPADAASPAARSRLAAWSRDLADVLAVLLSPRQAYRRLAPRRPLLVPWLVVALPSMLLSLLVVSVAQRASVHLLAELDDPALIRSVTEQLDALKTFAVLAAPAALWLQWTVTALLLWAAAVFVLRDAPFRAILSVVACAGLPEIFGKGVDLVVAWTDGPELGPDLVPRMTSAAGFAGLLPAEAPLWLTAFADRLTPFWLWSGILWTLGVAAVAEVRLRRAAAVTVPVWTVLTIATAALNALRTSMAGLAGAWSSG